MPDDTATPDIPAGLPDWSWPAGVALVALVNFVVLFPGIQSFLAFTLGDAGWPIATDAAWAEGLTPTVDFAYFYGLLTLVLDRGWFAVCGRTPQAQAILVGVCVAGTAWGAFRYARACDFGPAARAILLVGLPVVTLPVPPQSTVHVFEPLLLIHALALQAGGRPAAALVLVTICGFIKPSMAGVYAVVLAGIILFGKRDTSMKRRVVELLPAAGVGFGLAGMLAAVFGIGPLIATLFPTTAAKLYEAEGYGFFFGIGHRFVLPTHDLKWYQSIAYYLISPAGFWLVSTVVLVAGAVRSLRFGRGPAAGTLVTCAGLHLAFVFFFFGNDMSWFYYGYLLVLGTAAVVNRTGLPDPDPGRWTNLGATALALLAVAGQAGQFGYVALVWVQAQPTEATAGLYAVPADAAAWADIRKLGTAEKPVLFLARTGGARLLYPEVDAPRSWYLLRPVALPAEVDRVKEQIRQAVWIVAPEEKFSRLDTWPEFADEMKAFAQVGTAKSFVVYRRR